MGPHTRTKLNQRQIRHRRLRARLRGTASRPRLSVFRSARHLVVQLIDDQASRTLLGLTDRHLASLKTTDTPRAMTRGVARAFALGQLLSERAREKGITAVVFDRGGFAYHGQVRAVAEGARAGGLVL